jgi:C4-dicarboxylate transporter, DctM subunit
MAWPSRGGCCGLDQAGGDLAVTTLLIAALPLFVRMGEILFRTRLSNDRFHGRASVDAVAAWPLAAVFGSSAATLDLLIPPSIITIVYGVAAEVSIAKLLIAGIVPGLMLAALFSGYLVLWALRHPEQVPAADARVGWGERLRTHGT